MMNDTAQVLANCLDALERPGVTMEQCAAPFADQAGSLVELLAVAQTLRSAPAVTPSLDFRVDARQRLIAHLPARRSRRARMVDRCSAWGWRLVNRKILVWWAAFILLIGVVLGASVVVASAQSLPNEVLYPVKRTIEQARLIFAPDTATSSNLYLAFATERLAEVQRLIDRGRGAEAASAIDDFAAQMHSAVAITQSVPDTVERTSLLARVDESIKSSDAVLSRTQEQLPASAQVAVQRARAVLAERTYDPHDLQPPLLPLVSTVTSPAQTVTPHATPVLSRTLPSVTHGSPRWMPTPVEHHPVNSPTDRPTALPTRQPAAMPTNRPPHRTLMPPMLRTQIPFVRPTYLPPSFPMRMPSALPPVTPLAWPPPPATFEPRFVWPGSGGHR
jgi:hypothetical protein